MTQEHYEDRTVPLDVPLNELATQPMEAIPEEPAVEFDDVTETTEFVQTTALPQGDNEAQDTTESAEIIEEESEYAPNEESQSEQNTSAVPPQNPQVPLYSTAAPVPQPIIKQPQGVSVGTIVFGVVVLLIGLGVTLAGMNLSYHFFVLPQIRNFGSWLLAGFGILLTVIAIVWAIAGSAKKKENTDSDFYQQ